MPTNGTYECVFGTRIFGNDRVPFNGSPFKGTLKNILVYDDAFDATEALNDAGAPLGLTVTSNLVVRYDVSEDYNEGKVTASTDIVGLYDVNIRFADGDLSSDSYVAGDDYFTTKAQYGFVKDNATTMTYGVVPSTHLEIISGVGSLEADTNVIPLTNQTLVDEPVNFNWITTVGYSKCRGNTNCAYGGNSIAYLMCSPFGGLGDCSWTFEDFAPDGFGQIAVADYVRTSQSSSYSYQDTSPAKLRFSSTGVVTWSGLNSVSDVVATSRGVNDKWKIEVDRTAELISLFFWDGTAWIAKGTPIDYSSYAIPDEVYLTSASRQSWSSMFGNLTFTGEIAPNIMAIGNRTDETGHFSPTFMGLFGTASVNSLASCFIDGVEQNLVYKSTVASNTSTSAGCIRNATAPAVGTVNIYVATGLIEVNPAEVGKTLEVYGVPVADDHCLPDA